MLARQGLSVKVCTCPHAASKQVHEAQSADVRCRSSRGERTRPPPMTLSLRAAWCVVACSCHYPKQQPHSGLLSNTLCLTQGYGLFGRGRSVLEVAGIGMPDTPGVYQNGLVLVSRHPLCCSWCSSGPDCSSCTAGRHHEVVRLGSHMFRCLPEHGSAPMHLHHSAADLSSWHPSVGGQSRASAAASPP